MYHNDPLVSHETFSYLVVSGSEASVWLQGQLSCDMRSIEEKKPLEGCLLAPTGQVQALLTVWMLEGDYLIQTHPMAQIHLIERLERMVIMEDVAYRPTKAMLVAGNDTAGLTMPRAWKDRWRVLPAVNGESDNGLPDTVSSWSEFRLFELTNDLPRYGHDFDATLLPAEFGQNFCDRTIAPVKGCYVGQEVVERLRSRGVAKRAWKVVRLNRQRLFGAALYDSKCNAVGKSFECVATSDGAWLTGSVLQLSTIGLDPAVYDEEGSKIGVVA